MSTPTASTNQRPSSRPSSGANRKSERTKKLSPGQPTGLIGQGVEDSEKTLEKRKAQQAYQAELKRQMEEKEKSKQEEKLKYERLMKQKEDEIYDPFGKGGAGAPNRTKSGKIITDLKKLRQQNLEAEQSPRGGGP